MNDFISRVGAKKAVKRYMNENKYNKEKLDACLDILKKLCDIAGNNPVGAEPVVRCKDCKYITLDPTATIVKIADLAHNLDDTRLHRGKLSKETKNKYIRAIKFLRWGQ